MARSGIARGRPTRVKDRFARIDVRVGSAATAERVRAANELESQLAMTLYQLADAQRKMNLYRNTLIPKAAESLSVIQISFQEISGDSIRVFKLFLLSLFE